MSDLRPRRSVLYMPAANERALEKAKTMPADAIIFDLEDAVAPDAKVGARVRTPCAAASSGEYGDRELTIRCNGLDTPWGADDIAAAAASRRGRRRHPEGRLGRVPRRGVGAARSRRRAGDDDDLGDDRDADGDLRRARDRRAPSGLGVGDGHQRPRPRAARVARCRRPAPAAAPPGDGARRGTRGRHGDPRRRVQRREGPRRLSCGVRAGRRDGLRRQDADPPRAGRRSPTTCGRPPTTRSRTPVG